MFRLLFMVMALVAAPVVGNASEVRLERIAFGSGCRQDQPQPVWRGVVASTPQLWIWTGNIIYADTRDVKAIRSKYSRLKREPGYEELRWNTRVIGVWDDLDYGVNDGGREFPAKVQSQSALMDFLDEPRRSRRRFREGIYAGYDIGPREQQVRIILLDTRYHRDSPGADGDVLGDAQWEWLERQLRESTARINIIVSSIQFAAVEHANEKWANFPQARARMIRLLGSCQTPGVFFISGNRQLSEFTTLVDPALAYSTVDVTASGMNCAHTDSSDELNSIRIGDGFYQNNFGMIEIDWDASPVTIELQIRDERGTVRRSHLLALDDLRAADD